MRNFFQFKTISLLIGFVFLSTITNAQVSNIPDETLEYFVKIYQTKGLIINKQELVGLSTKDLQLIQNHDFDVYRNEISAREIKILNGPSLMLESIKERLNQNYKIDKSIVRNKSKETINKGLTPIITQVDLGIGRYPVENNESWQSK